MFMFYAKSYVLNGSGVKEFYMSYGDYTKFINDFCFANLQLSSVEAAHVFLASCSSPPFHGALFEAAAGGNDKTQTMDCNDSSSQTAESVSGSVGAGNSASSGIASIQRILESVEGVVAYAFPQNQVGRMCMGVSAFLDALGRIGLTAFTKTRTLKTIHCVKGDFDAIYWRPLNKKSTLTKDGITVTSMISVLPGNSVRTRYAFMKHLSDDKALSRCFSVVAEDRRLDLEADSEATRELWTSALVFLMREHRSRSVRQT
ncbi:hypothetical protein PF011_g7605 [Phytophthora fragariae]|uniref:PH domain-containing protein n=1 Tax=Phytophthora fragariae TaxID=53985 RepID=A0A6A3LAZ1_9STRA|nr:hypothetical protein PF003_g25988 [Phytophthora fragariae]KAE9015465.1 hypothetical protein PF011_g7605 [Phytophthora fragariae]